MIRVPLLLWLAGMSGAVAYAAWVYRPRHGPRRFTVSATKDGWEGEGEAWKHDPADEPDVPDPDPELSFKVARANYAWALGFGRRVSDCPKCTAVNQEREKAGLEPLPRASFSRRTRDAALFCTRCNEATYPMSEDTVMRYDPRYHRQQPDNQQEAA